MMDYEAGKLIRIRDHYNITSFKTIVLLVAY